MTAETIAIDGIRDALAKVGLPVAEMDDAAVSAAAIQLYQTCADFGAALGYIFDEVLKEIGPRLRRLAEFAEEIERLAGEVGDR